jgi:hypothetical protein
MRRLNFLEDEPWDEVNDDLRRRLRSRRPVFLTRLEREQRPLAA